MSSVWSHNHMIKYLVIIILDHTKFSLSLARMPLAFHRMWSFHDYIWDPGEKLFIKKLFSVCVAYLFCK